MKIKRKNKLTWKEKEKIPSATGSLQFALAKHDQDTDTMHKNQGHKEETHKKPSGGLGANHGLNRASAWYPERSILVREETHI